MKAIEFVLDYRCNAQCLFCFIAAECVTDAFSTQQVIAQLGQYYRQGARTVYFGGGEPTLRKDLVALVSAARTIGYTEVIVRTNAMRLAYFEYIETLLAAGVSGFQVPVWGHAELHNYFSAVEDAFERTEMAVKHLVDQKVQVELDFLITRSALATLPEVVEHFARIGATQGVFFFVSLFGMAGAGRNLNQELPRYTETAPFVKKAIRAGMHAGMRTLWTSHIPPCMLGDARAHWYNAAILDLLVLTPGSSFKLEDSPFEKGRHVAACRSCICLKNCPGIRTDYLDVYGEEEFKAIRKNKGSRT